MIINGSDLMVFLQKGTGTTGKMVSVAYATNHVLNVTMNTQDISTKDNGAGIWQDFEAGLLGWTLQTDNLLGDTGGQGNSITDLFDRMVSRVPVDIKFALKSNQAGTDGDVPAGGWEPNSSNYYGGKAIITSLNVTAQNGEKATASATFQGCGPLKKTGQGFAATLGQPVAAAVTETTETEVKTETTVKK